MKDIKKVYTDIDKFFEDYYWNKSKVNSNIGYTVVTENVKSGDIDIIQFYLIFTYVDEKNMINELKIPLGQEIAVFLNDVEKLKETYIEYEEIVENIVTDIKKKHNLKSEDFEKGFYFET